MKKDEKWNRWYPVGIIFLEEGSILWHTRLENVSWKSQLLLKSIDALRMRTIAKKQDAEKNNKKKMEKMKFFW